MTYADTGERAGNVNASPAEIERDIAELRSQMDRTLDEIEYRLSPGQLSAYAVDYLRANSDRIGRVMRENPIPVAMIGIGVLWLAVAAARTNAVEEGPPSRGELLAIMDDLIRVSRQGVTALRAAQAHVGDPGLRDLLREVADQRERTASALEDEARRLGSPADYDALARTEPDPAWSELHRALDRRDEGRLIAALDRGEEVTLAKFRRALHRGLPPDVRVVVGSHFHEVEHSHNTLHAMKDAVG